MGHSTPVTIFLLPVLLLLASMLGLWYLVRSGRVGYVSVSVGIAKLEFSIRDSRPPHRDDGLKDEF